MPCMGMGIASGGFGGGGGRGVQEFQQNPLSSMHGRHAFTNNGHGTPTKFLLCKVRINPQNSPFIHSYICHWGPLPCVFTFPKEDTEAVLLVCINSLNQLLALHNFCRTSPPLATALINSYRVHTKLLVKSMMGI